MKYKFHPEAKKELIFAVEYYEECRKGLGLEFANEVYKTIQRINAFPNSCHSIDDGNRKDVC